MTITHGLNAQDNGGNDACATLRAHSTYFRLYNVNVVNSYGAGKQATAVAVSLSTPIETAGKITLTACYVGSQSLSGLLRMPVHWLSGPSQLTP